MSTIHVHYQKHHVGVASFDAEQGIGAFEYSADFLKSGIELSPIKMPLAKRIYTFPELDFLTFKGLPGLIADSLPDDFGNAVMNEWIASQGRSSSEITPLERLQYTGARGMGALEYRPATRVRELSASKALDIESLVNIAQEVLDTRGQFNVELAPRGKEDKEGMMALLSVGMSAGGARPKAVVAFNNDFTQVRSGQTKAPKGFTHYLMKFDGVSEHNKDQETFGDPQGYGAMEYVYSVMAGLCGVKMMPCHLLPEGKRRHFITQRFDRVGNNKIHVQTLNGIAHIDYKNPGIFSYSELFEVARKLRLTGKEAEQLFRRMVFNIVARNHDDHSKNFSFMLRGDKWHLAPAYDIAYSYKPGSKWVNSHWMSLNGKRDDFIREDFYIFDKLGRMFTHKMIDGVIDDVIAAVSQWSVLAKQYDVPQSLAEEIDRNLRLNL